MLGNPTNGLDLSTDIGGDQLAVSPHSAFEIDKVIGLCDGLKALFDLLALLAQTLVLMIGRFKGLLGLFKTHGRFWWTAWSALFGLITSALKTGLRLIKLLLGFGERPVGGSLFGSQGRTNSFAEFMLDMEQVR